MKCSACEEGQHYLCGMQTWCDCDCVGPDEAFWGPSPDDDMPHADTCTCEHCAQMYPERLPESWEDDDDAEQSCAVDVGTVPIANNEPDIQEVIDDQIVNFLSSPRN